MVEEIKEEEKLEHQTNKQWYDLTMRIFIHHKMVAVKNEKLEKK